MQIPSSHYFEKNPELTGKWRIVTHPKMGTDVEIEVVCNKPVWTFWRGTAAILFNADLKTERTKFWVGSEHCYFKTVFVPEVLETFECEQTNGS